MTMNQVDPIPHTSELDRVFVARIFEAARAKNQHILGLEAFDILKAYGIPVVKAALAKTLEEAISAAEEIGYPLVMKVVSPQISHKSDIGGIRLSLQNAAEVKAAYQDIIDSISKKLPGTFLEGVQLQPMLSGGKEVILGMVNDPTFGPILMFGLGGVYIEILKDIRFEIAPVDEREAREMVTRIKTYPLLAGTRGEKPSDIDALVDIILKVSRLVCDFPEIEEFEINPIIVLEKGKGALAVDLRLILKSDL